MINYLRIGQIISTHGVMGELKIYPLTDNVKRFSKLKFVFFEEAGEYKKVEVKGVKYIKELVILKLNGINNMDEAMKYKDVYIYIDRENAIKLPSDSYFISDLIDMEVNTIDGDYIGKITSVFSTGSNDVYDIKGKDGKSVLIPAIKDVVINVDVENKKMVIKLLEGLIWYSMF